MFPDRLFRRLGGQNITATATSQASNPAPPYTDAVLVVAIGAAVRVSIGAAPVAGADDLVVPTNSFVVLAISPGERVAVQRDGGTDAPTSIQFLR